MMIIIKDLAVELAPKYAEQDSPIDAMLTERIRDRLNEIEDDTQVGGRSARHAAAATTGYRALAVRAGGGAYPQGGRPPAGGRDDAQAGGAMTAGRQARMLASAADPDRIVALLQESFAEGRV